MKKYDIKGISLEQLSLIESSIDLAMRLRLGQIKEIENFFLFQTNFDRDDMRKALVELKKVVFPDQSYDEYVGIFSTYCNPVARECYDIYQQIKNVRDEYYHVMLENEDNKFEIKEREDDKCGLNSIR